MFTFLSPYSKLSIICNLPHHLLQYTARFRAGCKSRPKLSLLRIFHALLYTISFIACSSVHTIHCRRPESPNSSRKRCDKEKRHAREIRWITNIDSLKIARRDVKSQIREVCVQRDPANCGLMRNCEISRVIGLCEA